MKLINDVVRNYKALILSGQKVPVESDNAAFASITEELPEQLQEWIPAHFRYEFQTRGGVGQLNYNFAKIPWVVTYDPTITTTPQDGYFLALIFRENLKGFYIGLNVGFTQFRTRYGPDSIARLEAQRAANYCATLVDLPDDFGVGAMDLAATGPTGKGYEVGSIAARYFEVTDELAEDQVRDAFRDAISLYVSLRKKLGGREVLDVLPNDDQSTLKAAVAKIDKGETEFPDGPVDRPNKVGVNRSQWRRNEKVVGRAISRANFKCELDTGHTTFAWRGRSHDFIEAHHLIPMSLQEEFAVSLDVPENVVAVCPLCHRKFHSGKRVDLKPVINRLLNERSAGLSARGLQIDSQTLLDHYIKALADDD